jgi:hypothetical protein
MENPKRKVLFDELNHRLLDAEKNVAKIKVAMKACLSSSGLGTLVSALRTEMGNKDALESQLERLNLPTPLFCGL